VPCYIHDEPRGKKAQKKIKDSGNRLAGFGNKTVDLKVVLGGGGSPIRGRKKVSDVPALE